MSDRELRAVRKHVKYGNGGGDDSGTDSSSISSLRAPRSTRVTAQEAARLLSTMEEEADDSEGSPVRKRPATRSGGESSTSQKGKDSSVANDGGNEKDDSQDMVTVDDDSDSDSDEYVQPKSASGKARKSGRFVAKGKKGKKSSKTKKSVAAGRTVKTRSAAPKYGETEAWEEYQPVKRKRGVPKERSDPVPKSPKPKRAMPAKKTKNSFADTAEDKKQRLDYLLKQSETFAHIMTSGGVDQKPKDRRGHKRGAQPDEEEEGSTSKSTDHRHARHGSSEDKEVEEIAALDFTRFEKTPFYIEGGEMRDYQVRGLNWLISLCENNINGILADEMGLGKTLQTISVLGYMYHIKKSDKPHLVIVPKSTLSNWQAEFKKWCPSLESALLKGDPEEREEFMKAAKTNRTWDVLITSYELALIEQTFIRKIFWGFVVIDEAHRIKSETTKLATAVRTFKSSRRLLLTGTPLQNNLHELWALLNFLLPDIFESSEDFDTWFGDQECQTDMNLVGRLHSILRPFLLRRVKADVEKNLPPKTEIKLFVSLTPMQRTWYKNVLLKDISVLNSVLGVGSSTLHNILMHLRKVCNHPYLFEGAEPGPPYTTERHIVDNCGKLILLDKLLARLKEKGSRVLIFSQMTRVLDILEDYCMWQNYEHCRLDGSTPHDDREEAIRDFNSPGSSKFIFLLSTRAGGLGINLTSADTVILYDSDWNPQVDLQAMDRVHRIGQTKPVTVFRLITENTVEERIIERAERKMRLDALVIQGGRLVEQAKGLGKDEIQKMIRFGAQQIIHSSDVDINNIADLDIDTILEQGKLKTAEMNKKFGELSEDNLRAFANDYSAEEKTKVHQFEGEDYKTKQMLAAKLAEMEQNWISLPKRERKQLYDLSGASTSRDYHGRGGDRDSPPWVPPPKIKKIVRPQQYRFLDIHFAPQKLNKLLEQEQQYFRKAIGFKVQIDPTLPDAIKAKLAADQASLDATQPLTPEEEVEKNALLKKTFGTWKRSDVSLLLRGLEQYGPNDPDKVALFLAGSKSPLEVKAYLPVFLERYETLTEGAKFKARIQKGILNQDKHKRRREAIKIKLAETNYPEMDLKIPYPGGHLKSQQIGLSNSNINSARMNWLEEEDRFLLCAYGAACDTFPEDSEEMLTFVRDAIRSAPRFKFDYMMRSITYEKVKERLDVLLNWIMREMFPTHPAGVKMPPALSVEFRQAGDAARRLTVPGTGPSGWASSSEAARKTSLGASKSTPQMNAAAAVPKTFTLKYAKEGKFQMAPTAGSGASTSSTRPLPIRPIPSPTKAPREFVVTPTRTQNPPPKVLSISPSLGRSAPVVVAKPAVVPVPSGSKPVATASGSKTIPTASGKKLPLWAMAADASASRSAAAAAVSLRVKRKTPPVELVTDDDDDDDEEIMEVFATAPKKANTTASQ
ncbi:SWI/SNF-related matrix-associated actin-dependent regulator of chromatin subfamily A member 5 [Hypsibius exemplaris]|uniref:SWI/SNF-related matrix-associated actin-dependent regulator of chromatin subfamily A member 5 n=1 Tax=Hypsibius exemplaris TaxID=2072580 RepID=A0A1W0WZ70_HYPEX|nr:SWI/SNF-related matrix-associated actin-dependent regulator of chromatin subfamily A member 5 [Hypsibius exemplaris]